MMHTILAFLKFGRECDIIDLYRNGTIFCNPIQRFREFEDNSLRGDSYEGVVSIRNLPSGQFEISSFNFKGTYVSFHIKEKYDNVFGNIYSLYCISSKGWNDLHDFKIDCKMKRFGSHCLLIKDPEMFLRLLESKLSELGLTYYHNFIDYYNKSDVNKRISLFEKPLEFEYQKEFRFYIEQDSTNPLILTIGSLADISAIFPVNYLIDGLRLGKTGNMNSSFYF